MDFQRGYQRGNENCLIKNDFLSPNGMTILNNCTEDIVF